MSRRLISLSFVLALAVLLAGPQVKAQMEMPAKEKPSIKILAPKKGRVVTGTQLTVKLQVKGVTLRHPGEHAEATGHVHLFLDKVPDMTTELPRGVPGVLHGAQTTFAYKELTPGLHILVAVLGDGLHRWLKPPVVDSTHFIVVKK